MSDTLITCGKFFFKYRDAVFPIFFTLLILIFLPASIHAGAPVYRLDLLAFLVAALGEFCRVITVGLQYIVRGGLNKQVYADNLVTGGMFAHCRNPLYVGNILLVIALLMLANNNWVYLFGGAFILFVYTTIVAAEEQFLVEKFGDEFKTYCANVHRWIPKLTGFQATFQDTEFNWRRVVVKEYSSVYFWCFSAAAILTYKTLLRFPWPEVITPLFIIVSGFALATVLFLFVRFLKKSGRLTEDAFSWVQSAT